MQLRKTASLFAIVVMTLSNMAFAKTKSPEALAQVQGNGRVPVLGEMAQSQEVPNRRDVIRRTSEVLQRKPSDIEPRLLRAEAYQHIGLFQLAMDDASIVLGSYQEQNKDELYFRALRLQTLSKGFTRIDSNLTALNEMLALAQSLSRPELLAQAWQDLGNGYIELLDLKAAKEAFERGISALKEAPNQLLKASILVDMGRLLMMQGELSQAQTMLTEAVELAEPKGRTAVSKATLVLAAVYSRRGQQLDHAEQLIYQTIAHYEQTGDKLGLIDANTALSTYYADRKDYPNAMFYGELALHLALSLQNRLVISKQYESLIRIYSLSSMHEKVQEYGEYATSTYTDFVDQARFEIYSFLSRAELTLGNYEAAGLYGEKYAAQKIALYQNQLVRLQQQQQAMIQRAKGSFNQERQQLTQIVEQKEASLQQAELLLNSVKKQNAERLQLFGLIAGGLTLLLMISLMNGRKQKKKAKAIQSNYDELMATV